MEPSLPKRTMKSGHYWTWSLGLALAVLADAGGFQQESLSQPLNTTPGAEAAAAAPAPAAPEPAAPGSPVAEPAVADDTVDAAAQPISTTKPLPPGVRPTGPVAEVLRLADSGVEEGVILAYVTNSTSTFNLGAEEIIYLNDLGVPSEVITAMMQRDQALRELSANGAGAPPMPGPEAPAPAGPEPEPGPPPAEMGPQPDYAGGAYAAAGDGTYAPFYDSLAPYGTWVDVSGYGPCWQPTVVIVNPGWQPYCNGGRWVYTDCGWYWMSGYSWGWAPFHYGRWFRHNHLGWCWQPGNTWGPSWVCWRYSGSYCGWAPLPPAAGFGAGAGLTFHGQRVSSGCGFGLGVNSYTFVEVSHFTDHHLNRYALPRAHATQIYNHTVASATIVGSRTRVVNRGIPVSRVATASRTPVQRLGIREVNSTGAPGARGERLDGSRGTVSVFRPHFPPPGRTQPSVPPPSPVAPLILRGSDRSREATGGRNLNTVTKAAPSSSLVIIGRREGGRPQTAGSTAAPAPQATWSRTPAPRQDSFARPAATPRSQPFTAAETGTRTQPRWSNPRPTESRVHTERPQPYSAPTYSAPAQAQRGVRAPEPAWQPARSAPSAPAPSAPASRTTSSSGRPGR
jgi:Family of unknown function (DUF6600)